MMPLTWVIRQDLTHRRTQHICPYKITKILNQILQFQILKAEDTLGYVKHALAGHSSLATTQRYIEGSSDAKRRIVDLIS